MKKMGKKKTTLKGGEGKPYLMSRFAGIKILSGSWGYRA